MPLVVHPHFHPRRTGITRHVETILGALSPSLDARTYGYGIARGLPRITLRELLRRASSEGVVWHAHRNNELLVGLLLRRLAPKLKVVFTRHSTQRPSRYTRFLARKANVVVALTQEVSDALSLPARIVPHGVDATTFSPPPSRTESWKALGLPGTRGIGVIGRIRAEKGQGDFVEAVAPLLDEHPDWTPLLVGAVKPEDQSFADGLRQRAPRLVFAGERSDAARWYQGLTICVHPSHREAFSLALLEALASGCCVVASRLPAMEQVIEHGRNGLLFTPGNSTELRGLLEGLMRDPARAEAIGRTAAEDARARLGIDREASALREAYQAAWSGE